jgi:circadian clock protein KaiB
MTVRPTPKTGVAPSPATPVPEDWPELEAAIRDQGDAAYVLRLYVASLTPRSIAAIRSVKEVCERHLQGRYELEIIDIYQHPTLAKGDQIFAAPTLIKKLPLPLRRLIGDMADEQRVLVGLDLRTKDDGAGPRN